MKRIISAFLATAVCTAAMSIVLTACSSKTADSSTTTPESTSTSTVTETAEDAADNTQISSPITDRASLDEVNEAIGSAMKRPADLELTDEAWATIDDEEKTLSASIPSPTTAAPTRCAPPRIPAIFPACGRMARP